MRDYLFSCQYYTKSICLYTEKKTNVFEKFHLLVKTLNTNDDDNEAKLGGISTNIIRKFIDIFFIIISEKH